MTRWWVGLAAAIAVMTPSLSARADEQQACVAASEKAQQLRNAGKLSAAKEQLTICEQSSCPKLIAQDCTQWMSELLQTAPSIVPAAKDTTGHDLVDVKVLVDGKAITQKLRWKSLPDRPGACTRFASKRKA